MNSSKNRPLPRLLAVLALFATLASACASESGEANVDAVATTEPAVDNEPAEVDATTDETPTDETTTQDDPADTDDGAAAPSGDSDGADGDIVTGAVAAAEALVAILSDDDVAELSHDFGDTTIATSWSNLPACDVGGRAGIRHGDLSEDQVAAVLNVAASVLSDDGLTNYIQTIAADEELGGGDGDVWDADCYYMAFFGTPSTTEPWALQFGGHHYARTVAFTDGTTTVTPAFIGVEPRSFQFEGETVEPLAAKSNAIFGIFETLDATQLADAELDRALTEILLGPGADSFPESEGLLLGEASAETQDAVLAAAREWVADFEADVADDIMTAIEADLSATTVSWSTSTDVDTQDAYARIDGPTVWIEFINERGVGTAEIHQHSVYRDKTNDYGTAA